MKASLFIDADDVSTTQQAGAEPMRGLDQPVATEPFIDDRSLLARWRQGDKAAFTELIARHQGRIARLAQRLLGWPVGADVDDVVQEVFVRAWEKLPAFRGCRGVRGQPGGGDFGLWLTAITVNLVRSRQRRLMVKRKWQAYWRGRAAPESEPVAGPGAALERDEAQEKVRAAIAGLPIREREVIVLRYLEQMPVAQIAKATGTRPGTVEVRLHRAREKLRKALANLVT